MKWTSLAIFFAAIVGIFFIVDNSSLEKVTGRSATDTASVTFSINMPDSVSPPSGGGGGGGGSQNSVAPATYGWATSNEKSKPQEIVENYYSSETLKFAPITTSVATIKSPAERGRLTTRTMTFAIGLALIVIAILIALILSHSHDKKKHRFKRNKV
jgi:hypothetical protein